jgi:prepilin-type N-terminal cleavage/methylation domain-containing protein
VAHRPHRPPEGVTLVEILIVLAMLSIVLAMGVPHLLAAHSQLRVNLAAAEAASEIRLARMTAVRSRRHVAVRFETREDGKVFTSVYGDGDGDGVLARDIDAGIDPRLRRSVPLRRIGSSVRLGCPPGPPPRDPGSPRHRLGRLDDPIRFNRSDMVSFSPIGASTPGSLYLTDGRTRLAVVRVYGRTGKVKVMVYDRRTEEWK